MSHYDDYYDYDRGEEERRKLKAYHNFLNDLREFRVWKPGRNWPYDDNIGRILNSAEDYTKARIYDLRRYETESE